MDTAAFTKAVDDGLKLSKRIYAGKDRFATSAPSTKMNMERSQPSNLLPTAPMVYAVINDPGMVDNPDIPSYQPHVYGRCDPAALIPLQMNDIECHVECHVDVAVVVITGKWRVHCVMGSRRCDCRLVVPTGEQGSLLGVEVGIAQRSYSTRVICREDEKGNIDTTEQNENGGLIKPQLFFVTIPQVDGGCDISIQVSWAQKLLYKDGQLSVSVPFQFPDYVSPFAKIFSKREKISLIVNTGTKKEVVIHRVSHILKEQHRNVGKLSFLYEADVEHWSTEDFEFSYTVHCSEIFGGTLLQSPSVYDYDQREMFYMYLFPGNNMNTKVFRKEVVFVVDTSKSMLGRPIENVKKALSSALLELSLDDLFNIIAFHEEMYLFSSSLESATSDRIESATQWINNEFRAEGGTNIKQPLEKAMTLLSQTSGSLPHIFLVTDGSVEDERDICCAMKTQLTSKGSLSPRISTFGIGSYCNHYFLKMLSSIGKGQYEAAYDADSIEDQMHRWFRKGLSPILANITIDIFDHLEAFEVYPSNIPDLSLGCPLIVSGRYEGKFPDSAKAKGHLADMSNFFIDLKVQNAKEVALDKVVDKHHIDLLTSQTWFSESKQLEEKVIKRSIKSGIPSEYTCMILLLHESDKRDALKQKTQLNKHKENKIEDKAEILIHGMKLGFGNIQATAENLPSGVFGYAKPIETFYALDKTMGLCNKLCDCSCCVCFINTCSKMNDRLAIVMTQLFTALCCLACIECCSTVCCDSSN